MVAGAEGHDLETKIGTVQNVKEYKYLAVSLHQIHENQKTYFNTFAKNTITYGVETGL